MPRSTRLQVQFVSLASLVLVYSGKHNYMITQHAVNFSAAFRAIVGDAFVRAAEAPGAKAEV